MFRTVTGVRPFTIIHPHESVAEWIEPRITWACADCHGTFDGCGCGTWDGVTPDWCRDERCWCEGARF